MTNRLTTEEIQDLRAKSAAATKAPWTASWDGVKSAESPLWFDVCGNRETEEKNNVLIATMRNTIDRLLDEIEDHRRFRKTLGSIIDEELTFKFDPSDPIGSKVGPTTDAQN